MSKINNEIYAKVTLEEEGTGIEEVIFIPISPKDYFEVSDKLQGKNMKVKEIYTNCDISTESLQKKYVEGLEFCFQLQQLIKDLNMLSNKSEIQALIESFTADIEKLVNDDILHIKGLIEKIDTKFVLIDNKKIEKELPNEKIIDNKKYIVESKKEKIVIRDPKHSSYNFFSLLGNLFVYIIKFFTVLFSIPVIIFTLIVLALTACSIYYFKYGLLFLFVFIIPSAACAGKPPPFLCHFLQKLLFYRFALSAHSLFRFKR